MQYKILHSGLLAHGAQAVFSFIVLCAPRASTRHENLHHRHSTKEFAFNKFILSLCMTFLYSQTTTIKNFKLCRK